MSYILHIESTTTICSVAVSNDKKLIAFKELNNGYTHAENLHLFIKEVLLNASLKTSDLNAVSVSSGPGSYTGLRIGYSTAKGLAYALKIPLIVVNTLKALTTLAIHEDDIEYIFGQGRKIWMHNIEQRPLRPKSNLKKKLTERLVNKLRKIITAIR